MEKTIKEEVMKEVMFSRTLKPMGNEEVEGAEHIIDLTLEKVEKIISEIDKMRIWNGNDGLMELKKQLRTKEVQER